MNLITCVFLLQMTAMAAVRGMSVIVLMCVSMATGCKPAYEWHPFTLVVRRALTHAYIQERMHTHTHVRACTHVHMKFLIHNVESLVPWLINLHNV